MKRFKTWLIRRLTTPDLGELRRFKGADWRLINVQWSFGLNQFGMREPSQLVLTYGLPYEMDPPVRIMEDEALYDS